MTAPILNVRHYEAGDVGPDSKEGWYFDNEVHLPVGPYSTQIEAVQALNQYAKEL